MIHQNKTYLIALFVVLSSFYTPLFAQELSKPEQNFETLWNLFDRNYALFEPKNIDWDMLYQVYRPKVTSKTTDDELFQIMSDMLGHLNDNHVSLRSSNPSRRYCAGILNDKIMEDFISRGIVKTKNGKLVTTVKP